MKLKIYLAGAMEAYSGSDKAYEWRGLCKERFRYYYSITLLSPTDYYAYGENLHKTEKEIFRFDLHKVSCADLILVNLNEIRKSVGTCIEIYEAYKSEKPIIGFIDEDLAEDELIKKVHPWIYECCTRIETGCDSMESAILHIIDFYSES